MRSFLAWLADVLLGPACPRQCGYRARGPRTLAQHKLDGHCRFDHAGDRP